MAKNQVPEKVPKYRFAVWNVWYKTVHLKVCKIVECEMLGIVCLRIKITLLEPLSPHKRCKSYSICTFFFFPKT